MKTPTTETATLAAGVTAALGASTCCVLPLALVSVGLGGAWVAQLRALERFWPVFIGLALAAFAYAFYRLYLRPAPCAPDTACATPAGLRRQRIAFWLTLIGAKALILSPFVYGALASPGQNLPRPKKRFASRPVRQLPGRRAARGLVLC